MIRAMRQEICTQRGAALVEFAIVAMLFFVVVLGIFDFGRAIFYYNMISNAAREAARVGIIRFVDSDSARPVTPATICKAAAAKTWLPDVPYGVITGCGTFGALQVDTAPNTVPREPGTAVTVTVSYGFSPITPLIGTIVGDPLVIRASSTMIVER